MRTEALINHQQLFEKLRTAKCNRSVKVSFACECFYELNVNNAKSKQIIYG